jgi:hypothetical protein
LATEPSQIGELAGSLGRSIGLVFDWASPTRMGRLRGAGLIAALAAAFTWWADLQVLAGSAATGWGVAGTLALPVVAAGYWQVGEALRSAVPRAAGMVRVVGVYSVAVGTALHAQLVAAPPGAGVAWVELPLGIATAAGLAASSLLFSWAIIAKPSDYPRFMAVLSPASLALAVWLVGRLVPAWQESASFVAPQVAHLVFFALSVLLLEWRNPDRWE